MLIPYPRGKERLLIDLQASDYAFGLNGWYTYRDIFKDTHHIKFQLVVGGVSPVQKGSDSTGEWLVFFNDSQGNRAD